MARPARVRDQNEARIGCNADVGIVGILEDMARESSDLEVPGSCQERAPCGESAWSFYLLIGGPNRPLAAACGVGAAIMQRG